jgi:hypothetical protein
VIGSFGLNIFRRNTEGDWLKDGLWLTDGLDEGDWLTDGLDESDGLTDGLWLVV